MKCRFSLEFASVSDTGRVRSHNEDAVVINADADFAVLTDGMGGYNAGEIASSMATSIIQQMLEEHLLAGASTAEDTVHEAGDSVLNAEMLLVTAIDAANLAILQASLQEPDYRGMGTTVVSALFHGDGVTLAHVGDSRGYRLRDRALTQITRDHSLLQEQLDAGLITVEQAQFAQHKNLITRAVGVDTVIEADTNYFDIAPGDCYLLCSDGLSDMLSDARIAEIANAYGDDIITAARELVAEANEMGGRDNISVVLIRVVRTL